MNRLTVGHTKVTLPDAATLRSNLERYDGAHKGSALHATLLTAAGRVMIVREVVEVVRIAIRAQLKGLDPEARRRAARQFDINNYLRLLILNGPALAEAQAVMREGE